MKRCVFVDRDGTLGGGGYYCHPDEFELYDSTPPAIQMLNENDYKVIVITSQRHIALGEITMKQVVESFYRIQGHLTE